jgi:predicted RNA-binding protein with PUA-like domain/predicted transcriptional regulator
MPNYYLVKSEPYVFSFAELVRDGRAMWDGVRNFEARNNLRAMKQGDLLLFYHSNEGKEVAGVATVVATAYPDPTADPKKGGDGGDWSVVDVAPVCALAKPVTLDEIRKEPRLRDINLLRRNRLSVVPVTPDEFACILRMGQTTLPGDALPTTAPREKRRKAAAPEVAPAPSGRGSGRKGRTAAAIVALLCAVASPGLDAGIALAEPEAKLAESKLSAAPLLDARLADLDDRSASLRGYFDPVDREPKVVVVLHQDRKSAEENAQFKAELARLSEKNVQKLRVVALADVDGYNFWPAKGFVKDALRPLTSQGATVLVDWRGSVRKGYGLRSGQSAVFVLGPGGELQALARGKLSSDEMSGLLQTIRQLLPASVAAP